MYNPQFLETKNHFIAATDCSYPLEYTDWLVLNDNLKVAALFVNFYKQITLAWEKAKSEFIDEEDGISTVMQYLLKNVPIIVSDSKKYTPAYVYKIAYNCMGCLRRVQREQDRYSCTTSQYAVVNDVELDLFDTVVDSSDIVDKIHTKEFWSLIEDIDEDSKSVIEQILNGSRLPAGVSKKKKDIMSNLKQMLRQYKSLYIERTEDDEMAFASVLRVDDNVSSAVVIMPDGKQAVYYGDKLTNNHVQCIEFFGAEFDYVIPVSEAMLLKVVDVQLY